MKLLISFLILFIITFNCFSQNEITSSEILEHIKYLSSDELTGRFPGTKGDKLASEYIVNDFKKNNLKLLFNNGLQNFDIPIKNNFVDRKLLKIDDFTCKYVEEYLPLSYSPSSKVSGKAVFVGYGLENTEWNDYEGVEVKGRWVVMLRAYPEIDEFSAKKFSEKSSEYQKIILASQKGAIGVIFINGLKKYPKDNLIENCFYKKNNETTIPSFSAKRFTGDRLLKKVNFTVEKIENELLTNKKPQSIDLKTVISCNITSKFEFTQTNNIVAYLEGSDSILKNEYIIIGAHYDHLGFGGCGSGSRKPEVYQIHNGADDNASGVSAVLEIAEFFANNQNLTKRSLIFVAFGAEERGLLGSEFFVNNLPVKKEQISAMINFDMIGKYGKSLGIVSTGSAIEFDSLINSVQIDTNLLLVKTHRQKSNGSDHASFIKAGIPAVFFYASTAEDYHTPEDDVVFIKPEKTTEIANFAIKLIVKISNLPKKLTFIKD